MKNASFKSAQSDKFHQQFFASTIAALLARVASGLRDTFTQKMFNCVRKPKNTLLAQYIFFTWPLFRHSFHENMGSQRHKMYLATDIGWVEVRYVLIHLRCPSHSKLRSFAMSTKTQFTPRTSQRFGSRQRTPASILRSRNLNKNTLQTQNSDPGVFGSWLSSFHSKMPENPQSGGNVKPAQRFTF